MKGWTRALVYLTAQACALHAQQLPLRIFTTHDGLVRNDISCMAQDSLGFLWLGASDGLSRYDGAVFTKVTLPGGLATNVINRIVADDEGGVWIAANAGGIFRYSDGSISCYPVVSGEPLNPRNRVNVILPLEGGSFAVGTDGGAFVFDHGTYSPLCQDALHEVGGVTAFARDADHRLWIGTHRGLFVMDDHRHPATCRKVALAGEPHIGALLLNDRGILWVGCDAGLRLISPAHEIPLPPFLRTLSSKSIRVLMSDQEGTMWIGTENDGVFKMSGGLLTNYGTMNGFPTGKTLALMQDREQTLWLAMSAGLCRMETDRILSYSLGGGIPRSYVSAIAQDAAGRFWFGSQYGLCRYDGTRFAAFSTVNGLPANYILSLLRDRTGTLWIGTSRGVRILPVEGSAATFVAPPGGAPLEGKTIRTLYEGKGIWAGWDNGFSLFRGGTARHFALPDTFRNGLVLGFARDDAGGVWVATQGEGLLWFAVDSLPLHGGIARPQKRLTQREGMSDVNMRSLFRDRAGILWAGSRFGGLQRIVAHGSSIQRIDVITGNQGLSGDWVRALFEDRSGGVWCATNRGADRITGSSQGPVTVSQALQRLGLAADDVFSMLEDDHGGVWLGTSSGVTQLLFPLVQPPPHPPPVYITKFAVLGVDDSVALAQHRASLSASQHSVSFEYIGLAFAGEGVVRYRTKLEGFDSDWSVPTDRRYAAYTHLPPGEYRFLVYARNADGVWSNRPAQLTFVIAPPFFFQWWFLLLVCAFLSGCLLSVRSFRQKRVREMTRVRSRIAADLHDEIGSTLTSISIFSRLIEEASHGNRAAMLAQRIGVSAQGMLESLDDIVWMVKPGNDNLDGVMRRLREFAVSVLEASGIAFSCDVLDASPHATMSLEDRRQFYLIAKEAVNNIARHSGCKNASVDLRAEGRWITLEIRDDGAGFAGSDNGNGDGIENMKRRAVAIGGHLTIASAPGRGTTILLRTRIA